MAVATVNNAVQASSQVGAWTNLTQWGSDILTNVKEVAQTKVNGATAFNMTHEAINLMAGTANSIANFATARLFGSPYLLVTGVITTSLTYAPTLLKHQQEACKCGYIYYDCPMTVGCGVATTAHVVGVATGALSLLFLGVCAARKMYREL